MVRVEKCDWAKSCTSLVLTTAHTTKLPRTAFGLRMEVRFGGHCMTTNLPRSGRESFSHLAQSTPKLVPLWVGNRPVIERLNATIVNLANRPQHVEIISTSPTGHYQVQAVAWEARNSLWVYSPSIWDAEQNHYVFSFKDESWSVDKSAWLSANNELPPKFRLPRGGYKLN